jgi:amino acid permease
MVSLMLHVREYEILTAEPFVSGGPAGAVYGFIFVWAGVAATFVVLSELASMYEAVLSRYYGRI